MKPRIYLMIVALGFMLTGARPQPQAELPVQDEVRFFLRSALASSDGGAFPTSDADADSTGIDSEGYEILLPDVDDNPDIALPTYKCFYYLKQAGEWHRTPNGRNYWVPAHKTKVEIPCDCEALNTTRRTFA